MTSGSYFLAKDCFVCRSRDHWIILNAARDQYLCVTHQDLSQIGARLHGWREVGECHPHPECSDTSAEATITSLVTSGIVTTIRELGKPFAEIQYEGRLRSLDPPANVQSLHFEPATITRMAIACVKADLQLRTRTFYRLIDRIKKRRDRRRSERRSDPRQISPLVHAFDACRCFYPRPYLCLFDSLALLEFLSSYRIYPHLVIGVVPDPFEAHCWLQEGAVVLNDDLERISKYMSIAEF